MHAAQLTQGVSPFERPADVHMGKGALIPSSDQTIGRVG